MSQPRDAAIRLVYFPRQNALSTDEFPNPTMKRHHAEVTIIGLRLIGSSIGLGLRRWATKDGNRDSVLHVTGFDLDLDLNFCKRSKR